jgi:glycine cleavage system H lipoate-binding protein
MDSSKLQSTYPLVPPNEQKCVWMTAGILSYQLCERQFDCDHCPLDSALRTFPQRSPSMEPTVPVRAKSAEKPKLMPGYLYSRKHCWIRSQSETVVRIGVEPMLAAMIAAPKTVVLPSLGEYVQANKVCAWIVTEGGTIPVSSPLDGEVTNVNILLMDQPHELCNDSMEHGWLFELTTGEEIFNRSNLFRIAEAERVYRDDERRFQALASTELRKHHAAAGATLPDGGQVVHDIAAMVGAEKYYQMLREVFS